MYTRTTLYVPVLILFLSLSASNSFIALHEHAGDSFPFDRDCVCDSRGGDQWPHHVAFWGAQSSVSLPHFQRGEFQSLFLARANDGKLLKWRLFLRSVNGGFKLLFLVQVH